MPYQSADDTVAARHGVAVTASDSTVLECTRDLYVGTSGDLVVKMASGAILTYKNMPVGWAGLQVVQVRVGTTAADIIAAY